MVRKEKQKNECFSWTSTYDASFIKILISPIVPNTINEKVSVTEDLSTDKT